MNSVLGLPLKPHLQSPVAERIRTKIQAVRVSASLQATGTISVRGQDAQKSKWTCELSARRSRMNLATMLLRRLPLEEKQVSLAARRPRGKT